MDLSEAVKETKKVSDAILAISGKDWDAKTRFIDLVEEVGELANALLLEHGDKAEKRRRSELIDSVCDVLFDVLMLADAYGIDLNKEYPKVLEHLRQRAEKGGFV